MINVIDANAVQNDVNIQNDTPAPNQSSDVSASALVKCATGVDQSESHFSRHKPGKVRDTVPNPNTSSSDSVEVVTNVSKMLATPSVFAHAKA